MSDNKIRDKFEEKTELQRFWRNCRVSLEGTRLVWQEERTFRQWVILNVLSFMLILILRPGFVPSAVLVFAGMQILVAELLNTSVEAVVDFMDRPHHPLTKLAKDAGSAAVAFAVIGLVFVWFCVLWISFA